MTKEELRLAALEDDGGRSPASLRGAFKTLPELIAFIKKEAPLFHATTRAKALNIAKHGLDPSVERSGIIRTSYGHGYDDPEHFIKSYNRNPVSFMAERPSAYFSQWARGEPVPYEKITEEMLKNRAGINVFEKSDDILRSRPFDDDIYTRPIYSSLDVNFENPLYDLHTENFNPFIEPGDYFTKENLLPDATATGKEALDIFKLFDAKLKEFGMERFRK